MADYCQTEIVSMENEIKNILEDDYKEILTFKEEKEKFLFVITSSINVLVNNIINNSKDSFLKMIKYDWNTNEDVVQESKYVKELKTISKESFIEISPVLSKKYYSRFCDSFVATFISVFFSNIKKLRKISDQGINKLI
jgi:hypothetical protein